MWLDNHGEIHLVIGLIRSRERVFGSNFSLRQVFHVPEAVITREAVTVVQRTRFGVWDSVWMTTEVHSAPQVIVDIPVECTSVEFF